MSEDDPVHDCAGDQRLYSALRSTPIATAILAPDGRFDYQNAAFQTECGRSADELKALTIWDVLDRQPSDGDLSLECLLVRGDLRIDRRCRGAGDGHGHWVAVDAAFLGGGTGAHADVIVRLTAPHVACGTVDGQGRPATDDGRAGLSSLPAFTDRLATALSGATDPDRAGALLVIDVQDVDAVNATFGAAAGNDVPGDVARHVRDATADGTALTQVGRCRFAVLLEDLPADEAAAGAEALRAHVARPFAALGRAPVDVSAGVAVLPVVADATVGGVLAAATSALILAQRRGGSQLAVFDPAPTADVVETVSVGLAASALGVSASTVRRWVESGRFSAVRTAGGHRRLRRSDVVRELEILRPGPVVRLPRPPHGPMPGVGALLLHQGDWICGLALRSVYVGGNHGWCGAPLGRAALAEWLRVLGGATMAGDVPSTMRATETFLEAAFDAHVPLAERIALLDGVAQAVRAAPTQTPLSASELQDWLRLGRVLRTLAFQEVRAPHSVRGAFAS